MDYILTHPCQHYSQAVMLLTSAYFLVFPLSCLAILFTGKLAVKAFAGLPPASAGFLLGLFVDHEDGGAVFPQKCQFAFTKPHGVMSKKIEHFIYVTRSQLTKQKPVYIKKYSNPEYSERNPVSNGNYSMLKQKMAISD
jgi:hypothetical protein